MSGGWDLFGINFAFVSVLFVSFIILVSALIVPNSNPKAFHLDSMAGDEGED